MHHFLPICVAFWLTIGVRTILAADPQQPATPGKPVSETSSATLKPQQTVDRALKFLVEDSAKWRQDRGCATCHHGALTVWALNEAQSQGYAVNAEVSDEEVGQFVKLLHAFPRLETLEFKSTKITDSGLSHLHSLPQLRKLTLENAAITDAGLIYLNGLSQLELLNLKGTKVMDAGVQEFQKKLPNAKVER